MDKQPDVHRKPEKVDTSEKPVKKTEKPIHDTADTSFEEPVSNTHQIKDTDQTGAAEEKPAEVTVPVKEPRGITSESGTFRETPYQRVADVNQVPPTVEGLVQFYRDLLPGDLVIDKFGNKRGVVATRKGVAMKVISQDEEGRYSSEHLPVGIFMPQSVRGAEFKSALDKADREASSGTIASTPTTESSHERAADHRGHPEGGESEALPESEGAEPASGSSVGLSSATERSGGEGSGGATEAGESRSGTGARPGKNRPVDATGSPVRQGTDPGADNRGDTIPVRGEDYRITDNSLAIERSWPAKAKDNIEAIRILKQLRQDGRHARPDEQAILVRYVGWGASDLANNIFPVKGRELSEQWQALSDELRALLTDREWQEAQKSVNYAHFTGANIINALYKSAEQFGVKSGLTLEGGMGIGHFTGLLPEGLNLSFTGVEMDPVSARIAKALYPSHEVIQGDFTKVGFPDNHFDLTMGNPPYINQAVKSDPKYMGKGFMLHDYFIAKQIDALKPGGIGVFVTSSKTLDKQGQGFRQYVDGKANFLGAIRLPNTAFQQNSGTQVVTDLLFFQKKGEGVKEVGQNWVALGNHPLLQDDSRTDEQGNILPLEVNGYFLNHPDMVLGDEVMTSGRFGQEYTVNPSIAKKKGESQSDYLTRVNDWLSRQLTKALKKLPKKLVQDNPTPEEIARKAAQHDFNPKDKEDSFYIREDGTIGQVTDGYGQSVPVMGGGSRKGLNKKQQQYVRDYIPLREAVMNVYRKQDASDAEWQKAVDSMESVYDRFVAKNGPINQGSIRTINYKDGRPPGEQVVEPVISTLVMDPEAFRVAAIEQFDISTGEASKTRIFRERVLGVQSEPVIESAGDAVATTLNEKGYLDMDRVQALYPDMPMDDLISELGDSVFRDPVSENYVTRDDYLSGNVKAKLRDAKTRAKTDPDYQRNVKALEAIIPKDLPVASIPMNLGSFWVPESVISRFAESEVGIRGLTINKFRHKEMSSWKVDGYADVSRFATQRIDAVRMLEAALNQKTLVVRDNVGTSKEPVYKTNDKETAAANAKRQELKDTFERWARQDGDTADLLTKIYNRDFNTNVPRTHDGSHLTFPGLSSKYTLRPHQADVVWRIIQKGNTYMAHGVGAGKTLASIVSAMELKRLGIANKPTFAVLKSTLRQFSAEFLDAYPNARILVADEKQLDSKNRRRFMAKVANENWDAVIMTHESFGSMRMSDEFIESNINQQITELDDLLDSLDDDQRLTRKEIESRKGNLEQRLKKLAESATTRKDRGLTFEETGIDYLFIDEAHQHKKIGFPTQQSNLKGVDGDTAARASDLFMKTQYLETVRPGKHTVLMSGTPVSNTMGELFNIQRYLQPKVLDTNQISSFDAWTSAFADTTTNIEMQADGSFKPVTRLTRFVGVPGLMRDVLQVMDYVGMGQMREQGLVKLPKVDKQLKVTQKSPELAEYQKELGERIKRYEALTGKEKRAKGVDAVVKILGDGRKAAIDMRLVNKSQKGKSKLDDLIDNVFKKWQDTRDTVYTDSDGKADPVKGSIQLVFSDQVNAYDKPGGKVTFSVYEYIKDTLVSRGYPEDEIAFIGDYTNSMKKKRLFNEVNAGKKTLVIGGSDNLGTGVNVQKRLISLHNLDINYVPAKMDQRTGRGERQGNQNPEIENFLYVTEGTTDATVLQMNENKTRMADQVLRGDFSVNSMEDTSSAADDLAQAKAIASGNPLLLEQASVSADYRRLAAERDAHVNKLADYRKALNQDVATLESYERSLESFEKIANQYVSTKGDAFKATLDGKPFTKRKEAGDHLLSHLQSSLTDRSPKPRLLGTLSGYDVMVRYNSLYNVGQLFYKAEGNEYEIARYQDGDTLTPVGLVTRAENQAANLSRLPAQARQQVVTLQESIARYRKGLEEKFPYEDQLRQQRERLDEINQSLEGTETENTEPIPEPTQKDHDLSSRYSLQGESAPKKNYQTQSLKTDLNKRLDGIAHVVAHESDLPQHLYDQIKMDDVQGRVKGVYDPRTDEVYVIAANADNVADGLKTALHEAVGHKGLRNVLGDGINRTLDQIYDSLPERQRQTLRKKYINQIAGKSRKEQRRIVAEEHLAHLAETDPKNNWVQRAIVRARRWLRDHFPGLKWSDAEARQLLIDAKQSLQDRSTAQRRPKSPESSRYSVESPRRSDRKMSVESARQVAKAHLQTLNTGDQIQLYVAESSKDIYGPKTPDFKGAITGGRDRPVLLVASGLHSTSADLRKTIDHEVLAHYGLAKFLTPKEKQRLLNRVKNSRTLLKPAWDEIKRLGYGNDPIDVQAEEVIAYIAENPPQWDNKGWRRIANAIVETLQKAGLFKGYVARKDIEYILSDIASAIHSGDAGNRHFVLGGEGTALAFSPNINTPRQRRAELPVRYHNFETAYVRTKMKVHVPKETPEAVRYRLSDNPNQKQDTPDSLRDKLDALGKLDKETVRKEVGLSWNSLKEMGRAKGLGILGGRQITEMYKGLFDKIGGKNPLELIGEFTQNLSAMRSKWANDADGIDQRWARLARTSRMIYDKTNDLMHQSTIAGVDPSKEYEPKHDVYDLERQYRSALDAGDTEATVRLDELLKEEAQRKKDHAHLKNQFEKALNDDARSLFNDVRDYYERQQAATETALIKRLKGMNLDPGSTRQAVEEVRAMFQSRRVSGPYFPLMRFGQFAAIGETPGPDGKPFRMHFETLKALNKGMEKLESEGYKIESSGKLGDIDTNNSSGVQQFSGKLLAALDSGKIKDGKTPINDELKMAFMDEVNQIALAMMPELSAAKRSLHRKKVAGFDPNARRAFASVALHGANRLGRIQYGWRIQDQLDRIEEAVKAESFSSLQDEGDQKIVARNVLEEMKKRHNLNMNPDGHPLAAHIGNLAFFWYLGGSAAAGLVNMSQNVLVGLPQLGSRYGYARTSKAMAQASKDYFKYGGRKFKDLDDRLQNSWFDLSNSEANKHLSKDELLMIESLIDDGTIDTTQAHTLASVAGMDIKPENQKTRDWYTKMMRGAGAFFHQGEVANRQIMALTAFRLYKEGAKGNFDQQKAVDFTRNAIFDAHFDYSSFNRPRHMKGNWAKTFLIFKQHSQNMSYFLGKSFYDGFVSKDMRGTEQAAQAKRALIGTLGLHAVFAGAMGLPGMSMMLWFAGLAMGDEDDPVDTEGVLRNFFVDIAGPVHGHALADGVFNAYTGIDIGSRIGANDLIIRGPGYEMPARQEAMHYVSNVFGGPAVSQAINMWVGVDEIGNGETMKGLQRMLPKFIRDGMKTLDYTENGVLDSSGKPIVEELTLGEKIAQAAGFSSSRVSLGYEARNVIMGTKNEIQRRKSQLLEHLDRAVRKGDAQAEQRVRAQIDQYNHVQEKRDREWALIKPDTIRRSLSYRKTQREESESGVFLPESQAGMREAVRFMPQ